MGIVQGVNNTIFLVSVLDGKPVTLDHLGLAKALKLNSFTLIFPNINLSRETVFDKDYRFYISFFCGVEVPPGVFTTDKRISMNHFLPKYQSLAMIIRENIFSCGDTHILFADLKLMYKLVTPKICFSLPYMIICKMLAALSQTTCLMVCSLLQSLSI